MCGSVGPDSMLATVVSRVMTPLGPRARPLSSVAPGTG